MKLFERAPEQEKEPREVAPGDVIKVPRGKGEFVGYDPEADKVVFIIVENDGEAFQEAIPREEFELLNPGLTLPEYRREA